MGHISNLTRTASTLALGIALASTALSAATAQDVAAPPAYGSSNLSAGFAPDPTSIAVQAGGAAAAYRVDDYCSGYISHMPSHNLYYEAGSYDLFISAASDVDAVLVVNTPDGEWHCNDDGDGIGLNPGIEFSDPQSGLYNIWVGTLGSGSGYEPAMLHISELEFSQDNPYSVSIDGAMVPQHGSQRLRAGFVDDPRTVSVLAGGELDLSRGTDGYCYGYAGQAPDFAVDYSAGSLDLYFSMEADVDTTLAVQLPDGSFVCDDDSAQNLNPGVQISDPQSGRYSVWAGRYSEGSEEAAMLYVSELGFLGSENRLDPGMDPTYGQVNLSDGFTPDPYQVSLDAGGDVDASSATQDWSCRGYVAMAPDYRLNYSAGDFDLYLSAMSQRDITLVVNAPDGSWHCDDDTAGDLNPGVMFDSPQSGQYDIWVGTFGSADIAPAELFISELGWGGDLTTGELDYSLPPNYGSVFLSGGFVPDPHVVDVQTGGSVLAEEAADYSCTGYVSEAPDFELEFEPGTLDLHIYVESDLDTTLVVNDPNGDWVCNDDDDGLDAGLTFDNPEPGLYHIWVGAYGDDDFGPAQLNISELPRY